MPESENRMKGLDGCEERKQGVSRPFPGGAEISMEVCVVKTGVGKGEMYSALQMNGKARTRLNIASV